MRCKQNPVQFCPVIDKMDFIVGSIVGFMVGFVIGGTLVLWIFK